MTNTPTGTVTPIQTSLAYPLADFGFVAAVSTESAPHLQSPGPSSISTFFCGKMINTLHIWTNRKVLSFFQPLLTSQQPLKLAFSYKTWNNSFQQHLFHTQIITDFKNCVLSPVWFFFWCQSHLGRETHNLIIWTLLKQENLPYDNPSSTYKQKGETAFTWFATKDPLIWLKYVAISLNTA